MSGEYAALLWRRALNALRWAEEACAERDYDTCAREAEYAAQLATRSMLYRILSEEVRGHDIRGLLGLLVSSLLEQGFRKEAEQLAEFVRRNRVALTWLSEAHIRAAYGPVEHNEKEASLVLETARLVLRALEELLGRILG